MSSSSALDFGTEAFGDVKAAGVGSGAGFGFKFRFLLGSRHASARTQPGCIDRLLPRDGRVIALLGFKLLPKREPKSASRSYYRTRGASTSTLRLVCLGPWTLFRLIPLQVHVQKLYGKTVLRAAVLQ